MILQPWPFRIRVIFERDILDPFYIIRLGYDIRSVIDQASLSNNKKQLNKKTKKHISLCKTTKDYRIECFEIKTRKRIPANFVLVRLLR